MMDDRFASLLRMLNAGVLVAGMTTQALASFGDPLPRLNADQTAAFESGKEAFAEVEGVADGLGPVFNEASCGTCHLAPALGGGSDRVETRFGRLVKGVFDPLTAQGGSLMQDHAIGLVNGVDFVPEVVPANANVAAGRRTTPLFGLGLVDAVSDQTLLALAAREASTSPDTAGRVSNVTNIATGQPAVGKFGWKAQVPSLAVFSGDAYLNEMGITNPLFPDESCPQGNCALLAANPRPDLNDDGDDLEEFANFMTLLGPPPRPRLSRSTYVGARIFEQIGCTSCHVRSLVTGPSPIGALRFKQFSPLSDFLLHDMGRLGDGIAQGDAKPREMRTAPLWGLGAVTRFLHDGRTTSLRDAVLAHDGQGARARQRFAALRPDDQARLLAFLHAL
jgi:CxxC motif-containing protein (DUF1111 family)